MTQDTPKQRLVGRRRPPPIDALDPLDPLDGHTYAASDNTLLAACIGGLRPARDTLARAALAEALGPAGIRRLRANTGIAVIVEVPAPDWVTHVEAALRDVCDFAHIASHSGASRSLDKPTEGNARIGRLLSEGARVAGVSQAPQRYLPASLVAAADLYVRLGPPSNRTIAHVIREATGKRARRLPPAVAASLDFDTLTACIRLGTTPAECIARLQAATAGQGVNGPSLADVPDLQDLHGMGEAGQWCRDLVRDLEAWRAGIIRWDQIASRSALWASEPGTGKSSLARALAKATRLPLIETGVGSWFTAGDGYLGGVMRAAEQALLRAASRAPAILFLDEVDSIPNRATLDVRGRDFWQPVVNFMLSELDGATSTTTSRLIVIGATNSAASLDAALVRPGRLHPVLHIPRPDAAALSRIFRTHLGPDLSGVDLMGVAHLAAGATGADVVSWVRQARSGARAEARRMILPDLVQAVAPPDDRTEEEVRIIARHEASHAVAAVELDVASLHSVSIAAGRNSAGSTRARMHPRGILTRAQSEAIATVALAGRAMDALGGAPNTGAGGSAGSDLAQATATVAAMHACYGLGDSLVYRGGPEEVARAIDRDPAMRQVVHKDLCRLYARACAFVREHRPTIEAVADRLVAERVLSGEEVTRIIREHRDPSRSATRGGRNAS